MHLYHKKSISDSHKLGQTQYWRVAAPLSGYKFPSYGQWSWLAAPPSCQPHHHVNHPSSSSWEVQQFGSVWIHGWKHARTRNCGPWGRRSRICFRGLGPWSGKVFDNDAPAMRVCNRLWPNPLAWLRAAKHSVMLTVYCYAGLQLEGARRVAEAAWELVFDQSAILVLFGIAAGGCKTHCAGCTKRRLGLQKVQKR